MRISACCLLLLLGTALPGAAQVEPPDVAPSPADLGGPLVVGEVEIPPDEIKCFLIYGPLRAELEFLRIQAWIEHGIEQRVRESEAAVAAWEVAGEERGARPRSWHREDLEPEEESVLRYVLRGVAAIEREFPTLDLDTEIRREHRHVDWFTRELRQEVVFDDEALADDPDRWPPITFEVLREEAGEILVDDFRNSFERRTSDLEEAREEWRARVAAGDPEAGVEPTLAPEDSFYREILREIVVDQLDRRARVRTAKDGLSADLVFTLDIDGDEHPELSLTTHELWERVKERVSAEEIAEARRFLALVEATRQRLAREGQLMSPADAVARREKRRDATWPICINISHLPPWYPGSEFPSPEAYASYEWLSESYRSSVRTTITDGDDGSLPAVLLEQLKYTGQSRALAMVDVDVLLCSAFDFRGLRWKEAGWEDAARRAERLIGIVESGGAGWSELLREHSDFWDPPVHGTRRGADCSRFYRGEFGKRTWSDLRHRMAESDYSQFLNGKLLTDELFFHLPIGSITGPHRCHWGYCLVRVNERTPPTRPLDPDD